MQGIPQRPCFAVGFRNVFPPYRFWPIAVLASCDDFSDFFNNHRRRQFTNVANILMVGSCGVTACVGFDVPVCQHDVVLT